MKWYRFVSVVAMVLAVTASAARADIYRWDNGQVIPGTEGIEPGPGVQLDHMQLNYAKLGGYDAGEGMDLTGANFTESNRTGAILDYSTLMNAVRPRSQISRESSPNTLLTTLPPTEIEFASCG